jgi:hypothetical protein
VFSAGNRSGSNLWRLVNNGIFSPAYAIWALAALEFVCSRYDIPTEFSLDELQLAV